MGLTIYWLRILFYFFYIKSFFVKNKKIGGRTYNIEDHAEQEHFNINLSRL